MPELYYDFASIPADRFVLTSASYCSYYVWLLPFFRIIPAEEVADVVAVRKFVVLNTRRVSASSNGISHPISHFWRARYTHFFYSLAVTATEDRTRKTPSTISCRHTCVGLLGSLRLCNHPAAATTVNMWLTRVNRTRKSKEYNIYIQKTNVPSRKEKRIFRLLRPPSGFN